MPIHPLRLNTALLQYTGEEPSSTTHYWQVHPIRIDQNGVPHLEAGRGMTQECIEALCKAVLPSLVSNTGWIDEDLLAYGSGMSGPLVFFRPSVRRPIYFGRGAPLKSGMAPWPALVMVASPRDLSVYVVRGDKRPELSTPLYCAPFYNVYYNHKVCIGQSKIPPKCTPSTLDAWSEAFYKSAFTHPNANNEDFLLQGTLEKLWGDLLSGKRKRFPYSWLKPAKKTLKQLLLEERLYERK